MDKPRVKPLEWAKNHDQGEGGELAHGVGYLVYHVAPDGWTLHQRMNWHDAGSLKDAKTAAQADYEARILAALEPVTVQEDARVVLESIERAWREESGYPESHGDTKNMHPEWVLSRLRALAERGE